MRDNTLPVYRNPSESELTAMLEGDTVRVLQDKTSGDFIVWPSNEGLHDDIMKELNLDEDTADNLGTVTTAKDYQRLVNWVG